MKLVTAIEYMNAAAPHINPALEDRQIESVVVDSREVGAGDVFFALSQPDYSNNGFNGEFEDATQYVPKAFEKGAIACVVREDRFWEHQAILESFADNILLVPDPIKALQDLARGVYQDWGGPVVAITGSAGKTTAKELTAHVLEGSGLKVLKNKKNYNNGLGHPLTVLELSKDDSYDIAVLEMGMSTPMREISRLCSITEPDIAVVLNVLPVHVEHLGSIDNIARAKAEIVEGMKKGGTAVLNADDPRVADMRRLVDGNVVTFGLEAAADVTARNIVTKSFGETRFDLITPGGAAPAVLHLDGKHNVMNALASAAVAWVRGVSAVETARTLSSALPPPQRGEVLRFREGFTVVNDSYNSNPTALISMVRTIVEGGGGLRRRIVAAGEMLELGGEAPALHREAGRQIALQPIDRLIGIRGLAMELVEGAREAGLADAVFVENSDGAADLLMQDLREGDILLVKGSRGVRTERIVEKLMEKFQLESENDGPRTN
ncbi:MAG TPA: UDP-N-acetylmuramoyl-tripeptide--D-alanyl-D-alanine ligase [Pyrinomonadaceae bacterium]|nr:UDP-N-acetylmuramoyl-tripeptide--D-alanyl-D-alanine ligase [Pyrinomonadaceae bacterium]